ncbi:bacteriocin [Enterococcus faecalis]|uniref:leucocin A/sakacin P family class II bacteriocin n=1 Tax=Enterococcus TaxID=1350 RepID=UPI000C75D0AA|nr:leucocin A/sakacin P family class II bacteriocin [Enterococcus faecalis]PLA81343.1 bacteriocin [Enterococcus faecalis]
MKKKLVKALVICGMIGIGFTALGTNAEAATYYGNGLYCNKQKCWVDWSKAITIIGNNAVANWATRGHAGWNY